MKLRLLTMLLVCAAALSCGKERVEYAGGKGPAGKTRIGFSTGVETRAAALIDPAGLAAKGGFNVWAYSHAVRWDAPPSKTLMLDGTTVTGNSGGTSWSYDNPVEWPSDRFVSFFACGPAGAATVTGYTAENVPTVSFTVNPAPANQTDLLIAKPILDQTGPSYANEKPVNIRFTHALSRIVFSGILLNESGTETRNVKIKSITMDGLYDTGSSALSAVPAEWTVDYGRTASYTVATATGELDDVKLSGESKNVTSANGYLFLMPQSLERQPDEEPSMAVTLEIDGVTVDYPPYPLFSPSEWQAGKTYNYQIIVDGGELRIIGVDDQNLSLKPWEISVYVNPVMMIAGSPEKNRKKIDAAMKTLASLSQYGYPDSSLSPDARCKYFAIYFSGAMDMDVTVEMAKYDGFRSGDVVMLDAKKLVTAWGYDSGTGSPLGNYTMTAVYDETEWELMDAMQPQPDVWSEPCYPAVDAVSGATTRTTDNANTPVAAIRNKGSVILQKQ